jgi:RNA polymerase-binding transcription factor DksA
MQARRRTTLICRYRYRKAKPPRENELLRIAAAIRRIDTGNYGFCVVCEEPIAPNRLEADPAVPACVDCAR